MECISELPTTLIAYWMDLGNFDAIFCVQKARIEEIDSSAALDRVTIKEISISSALWVLEALYCLY